jgi:hypothetical protein
LRSRRLAFIGAFWCLCGPTPLASAQWSVSAFTGNAATASNRVRIASTSEQTDVTLDDIPYRDESSKSPVYYGARVMRQFHRAPWLGLEAEFVHVKVIADTQSDVRVLGTLDGTPTDAVRRLGEILPRFEMSHGLNLILANVVARRSLSSAGAARRVAIVGRAGFGPTVPHVEATFHREHEDAYQFGRAALDVAVGAEVALTSRLLAAGEVKGVFTRQVVQIGTSELSGSFRTLHLVAGLRWQMTAPASASPQRGARPDMHEGDRGMPQ